MLVAIISVAIGLVLPPAPLGHRCSGVLAATPAQRHATPVCAAAGSGAQSPWDDLANYNVGVWAGLCTVVDPVTAEPVGSTSYTLTCRCADAPLTFSLVTEIDGDAGEDGASAVEEWAVDAAVDADLDASYSAEHREGLAMASLLLNGVSADGASASADGVSASSPPALIEHSLAISDSERIRCFFAYGRESRTLERVFLLNERKNRAADALQDAREGGEGAAAAATSTPGDSRGRLTLNALLGVWAGDATLRRPKEASFVSGQSTPKGFGAQSSSAKLFGRWAANVFKARLTFAHDGRQMVIRRLGITAFDGSQLSNIDSTGQLRIHEGRWGDHESVEWVADPTMPRMLLLPGGCLVSAPMRLLEGEAFGTELAVLLEPGESFGWMSIQEGAEEDTEPDDVMRLVRSQRLYMGPGEYSSGTTSFFSLIGC